MAETETLKQQRDRFLAFSFASSDLFLEIDEHGVIAYFLGASKGLLGDKKHQLEGRKWTELFSPQEIAILQNMIGTAKPGQRCGPFIVRLNDEFGKNHKAFVTGIKMPQNNNFYMTLGFSNLPMHKLAELARAHAENRLQDKEGFTDLAKDAVNTAKSLNQDIDITLLDVDVTGDNVRRFGQDKWDSFLGELTALLRTRSVDGMAAAEIAEGRYSVIHDKSVNADILKEQIQTLAQEQDPTGEGIEVSGKTVTSNLAVLSESEATRAILYTLHEFERKGANLTITDLNTSFKAYLSANADKIKIFQNIILRQEFQIHFQPIVNLKTLELSHYEILSRFNEGETAEWIMFGEDVGLAADYDMAVCERALNFLAFKAGSTNTKFSVNLSGQSIENSQFFYKLTKLLGTHENIQKRLMFEITESSQIKDLNKVNSFITELHAKGYSVALDDFGAGSASLQYLQSLNVDHVKIDGKYIRQLLTSERDAAMVKNLVKMCKDLKIKTVAEYLENEAQLGLLRQMGVEYGQGYLLGEPAPSPDYRKPSGLSPTP